MCNRQPIVQITTGYSSFYVESLKSIATHCLHVMANPIDHYKTHRDTYDTISDKLDTVRNSFLNADRQTQKGMLLDSATFAVLSVQNDISVLERAFRAYCDADSNDDIQEACMSVNYGNNKFKYIKHNEEAISGDVGDTIITQFEKGNPWVATETMVDELMGVAWVKAPFVGAMLGFKDLMCVDTNVAQMIDDDSVDSKGYKNRVEYQEAISKLKEEYPEFADMVSTFMFQWILFDVNREQGVARHEEWFENMLPGTPFGRQTGISEY